MFGEPGLGIFIAFSLTGPVVLLGLVALAVVSASGAREPDPTGARQRAIYLAATSFVSLFVMVGALFAATVSLAGLIESEGAAIESRSARVVTGPGGEEIDLGQFDEEDEEVFEGEGTSTEAAVSGAVAAALVLVTAGVVFLFHRQRMEELVQAPGFLTSLARRPVQGYHYAVCFVAALVALVAAAVALYAVFRIALPDVASPDSDDGRAAARDLIAMAVLTGVSALVFVTHWRRPESWMRTGVVPGVSTPPPPPATPPSPPAPPAPPAPQSPPPRQSPPPPPDDPAPAAPADGEDAAPVPRWETPAPAAAPAKKATRKTAKAAKAAPKKAAAPTRKRAAKQVAPDPEPEPEAPPPDASADEAPDPTPGEPAAPEAGAGDREPPEAPVP